MSFDSLVCKCISKQYSSQFLKRKKRLTKIHIFKRQCIFLEKKGRKITLLRGKLKYLVYQRNKAACMEREKDILSNILAVTLAHVYSTSTLLYVWFLLRNESRHAPGTWRGRCFCYLVKIGQSSSREWINFYELLYGNGGRKIQGLMEKRSNSNKSEREEFKRKKIREIDFPQFVTSLLMCDRD